MPLSQSHYASEYQSSSINRLMTLYAFYRAILPACLLLLFYLSHSQASAKFVQPVLFVCGIYLIINTIGAAIYRIYSYLPAVQLFAMVMIDIIAICTLEYLQKDMLGSLNILLMVAIAAAGLTLRTRYAYMCAAMASISVLSQLFATRTLTTTGWSINIQQGGLLGIAYFSVCGLTHQLAKRLQSSEALTREQAEDINHLTELNQQIITRMRNGILVVTQTGRILLSNDSAQQMLGDISVHGNLNMVSSQLFNEFSAWLKNDLHRPPPLRTAQTLPTIVITFSKIDKTNDSSPVIVFIEDYAFISSRAQRMKLASLGRLSASIAHEIRNPLGAISHASQLLSESLVKSDNTKLVNIVLRHVDRVNTIIENVMQLSRRSLPNQVRFQLHPWMESFWADYNQGESAIFKVNMQIDPPDLEVNFDTTHLAQVLGNLLDNACYYSRQQSSEAAEIIIKAGLLETAKRSYIDVIDNGPGVEESVITNLFEPFHTTRASGTGLGLYICKELCETNQASLDYIALTSGACFRITFSHPKRRLVL